MPAAFKYRSLRVGNWLLKVAPERWSDQLQDRILSLVRQQPPSRRPQTVMFRFPDDSGELMFLKVFHPGTILGAAKDVFRDSKAFRSLRQGIALCRAGFLVPAAIAAGEMRRCGILKRAFILTLGIHAEPLPVFLRQCYRPSVTRGFLVKKRNGLNALGRHIRRLHLLGFVHGDLVPSNILVSEQPDGALEFYLLDNDRTRRYPPWLPQSLWKRNLVQLNRVPLAGITLQDRMRFFRGYLPIPVRSRANRVLRRWLEVKTRQRRKECDPAYVPVSFRKLMSWNGNA